MTQTIVLKDERCIKHETRYGHPESPARLEAIYGMLQQSDVRDHFRAVSPRKATREELAYNHSGEYIDRIRKTSGEAFVSLDPDTSTSAGSWEAALLAAGAVMTGADEIMAGNALNGFALVRPPGHHAEASRAMGFCLFNNIAVGAHHLIRKHGLRRIMLVDWDIHHGNGTQNSFYSMPEVLYVSTHQYPYYPGTGAFGETGQGAGRGFTVNVPLPGGQDDDDYLNIFSTVIQPLAKQYRPEFIMVSAGYDIFEQDPLGTMAVTTRGFGFMAAFFRRLAEELCGGRLMLALEGGYNVQGLAESVKQTLLGLAGQQTGSPRVGTPVKPSATISNVVSKVKSIHADQWKCFK